MLSKFFLDRPVFAWVIAIVIMVLGGLAIYNLPISQYPPIAPPSIAIDAFYPGASADTVENSVTQIIEQKMTGFEDMLYLSGTSDASGASRTELTFKPGTDPDLAWAKVQNKLQLAMSSLPGTVQNSGVMVSKSTRNYLIIVGLVSEDGSMDGNDLRDYAQSNLEKVLARVPGVGEVQNFGSQYAMRVWLNPDKLTDYHLTIEDVIAALRSYNVEVSAGQFGGAPAVAGQRMNTSIIVQSMLKTPDEFAAIPLRTNPDGSVVRVKDVGRTELGTEFYDVDAHFNGKPVAGLAIRQAAGANALDTANAVKKKMEEMSHYFPSGMKVVYPYDTTLFVRVSINEVIKTLFIAILLVFLVMWLFMGNIRATMIPTIAVPVVLLGTFAMLGLFGYSINMLTMFAMVLAIGLLVDDAIVVVENVERIMVEEGLPPREATAKSMEQITSALIGIGLVLSAVFGPMAFFPGSTGVIYRQFSVTIIASMLLSVFVALILTPVLCATFLKPVSKGHEPAENAVFFLRPFFILFDRFFFRLRDLYVGMVGHSLSRKLRYVVVFLLIVMIPMFVSVLFFPNSMYTRYILFIAPFAYVLIALGIRSLYRFVPVFGVGALLVAVVVSSMGLVYYFGSYQKSEYRDMAAYLRYHAGPTDAILLEAPRQYLLARYYLPSDLVISPVPLVALTDYWPVTAPPVVPEAVDDQLQALVARHSDLWLVLAGEDEVDPGEFVQRYLTAISFQRECNEWLDVRLCHFTAPRTVPVDFSVPLDVVCEGEMRLRWVDVSLLRHDAHSGSEDLLLMLQWEALDKPIADYTATLRLLNRAGGVEAQMDSLPIGPLLPPTTWASGDQKPGYMALPVPEALTPGVYDVVLGLYNPAAPELLRLLDSAGGETKLLKLASIAVSEGGTVELLQPDTELMIEK